MTDMIEGWSGILKLIFPETWQIVLMEFTTVSYGKCI